MCKKIRKALQWEPVEANMLPTPENCPNAIFNFYNKSKSDSPRSADLKSNVKKHLLFLNWSIEYKPQENCSNKFRYLPPDRQKIYYSLNSLCADLVSKTDTYRLLIKQSDSQMEKELPLIPQDNRTLETDTYPPPVKQSELQMEEEHPLIPQDNRTSETDTYPPVIKQSESQMEEELPLNPQDNRTSEMDTYPPLIKQLESQMEEELPLIPQDNRTSEMDTYCSLIKQSESQMDEELPLIPQDNQTWNLSSPCTETFSLTSLLTEQFYEFRDLRMETLSPILIDDQSCISSIPLIEPPVAHKNFIESWTESPQTTLPVSPLSSSLFVEPQVYEYLKNPPIEKIYSIPQEESPVKILSSITQDCDLAIVPSGPLIEEKSKSTKLSGCESADIGPEYCHEAVVEYFNLGPDATRGKKEDNKIKDLRTKVKKHMVSVGWKINYIYRTNKRELRYVSPSGRSYISLITACKGYLDNQGNTDHIRRHASNAPNSSKQAFEKLPSQKRPAPHHDSSYLALTYPGNTDRIPHNASNTPNSSKYIFEKLPFQKRPTPHNDSSYLALTYPTNDDSRLTKKARPPPPPVVTTVAQPSSRLSSRNLLARLIDSNEVAVGEEVHYRGRDGRPMAEGHVTDDGLIKCNCCQGVLNLSSFEAHAGSTNHRPAANIFLKDGRSLQDCQLLLKPDDDKKNKEVSSSKKTKKVNGSKKNKKVKGNNIDHRSKGYRCSICSKFGALVLCYQCPSKFHTTCLGLQEVPYGDWFCKTCEDEPSDEAESCPQAIVDYLLVGNILTRIDDKNKKLKDLRSKAKKHLCSIGWSFFHDGTKRELQYKSPGGRVYSSLIDACEGCIFEDGDGSQFK